MICLKAFARAAIIVEARFSLASARRVGPASKLSITKALLI